MKRLAPLATAIFFGLVCFLLVRNLSQLSWSEFHLALGRLTPEILLPCAALVFLNYLVLTTFDYLGFRHISLGIMTYPRVVISAFISYAINLNLGPLVGGIGFRFRIYTGWGVRALDVPKIVLFSTITNLLGHTTLLGLVFSLRPDEIADLLPLPPMLIRWYGILSLMVVVFYLWLCQRGRPLNIRRTTVRLPNLGRGLLQILLSCLQWGLISLIIYLLVDHISGELSLSQVLFTTLVASVAGVVTQIPAGLGVLEAVFLKVDLGVGKEELLAALLAYRALYYLLPLCIAAPAYLFLEIYQKRLRQIP